MDQKGYLVWKVYRPSPLCTKNFKEVVMFLHGQKGQNGQNVEVIFWVKKVKRSWSLYENHEN